ncbi:hypothetical protein BKA69DRAFT_1087193 [Paraphysoderma sedebokerense]|nr:hypothetical protein BKA69DRAFT_1087193 [Paraphysoderma sedebokerense]
MTINPKIFFLTSADLPNFRSSIQSLYSLTNNTISDQYLEDLVRSRQLVISIDPQTNKVLATSRILITADHFRVQDILTTLKLNTERELPFFYYGGHGLQEIEKQLSRNEYPYAGAFNYDVEKDVVVYISNSVVHPDIESSVLIKMFQKAIEKELYFLQSQFGRTRDSRVNLVFTKGHGEIQKWPGSKSCGVIESSKNRVVIRLRVSL